MMDKSLVGLSVVLFVGLFCLAFLWKGYAYYAYFFVVVEIMLLYWRFFLSPLRHHNFRDDLQYLKYRAFITQGRRAKAHLRDEKQPPPWCSWGSWSTCSERGWPHATAKSTPKRVERNTTRRRAK
ncbi:MAG: hypothetical protein ACTSU5_22105 [Promethearchaeota archaeon]